MMLRVFIAVMMMISLSNASGHGGHGHKHMKKMFQSVPVKKADIRQTGKDKMYCPNCGMNLPKFWKTSHAVELKDGTTKQFCSIHCLVEQQEITKLRDKKDQIVKTMVVDTNSLKYIDVQKAHYVVGSKKGGTMTAVSEYAFASKSEAKEFMNKFGGQLTDYEGAYSESLKGFSRDMGMLLAKRSAKMYNMGKMIYNKKCDKDALSKIDADSMAEMKASIRVSKVCGKGLNDKQLQATMLYYWDVKLNKFEEHYGDDADIQKYAKSFEKKFKK